MPDYIGANQVRTLLLFTSLSWSHFYMEGAKASEEVWGMPLSPLQASQVQNRGKEGILWSWEFRFLHDN